MDPERFFSAHARWTARTPLGLRSLFPHPTAWFLMRWVLFQQAPGALGACSHSDPSGTSPTAAAGVWLPLLFVMRSATKSVAR